MRRESFARGLAGLLAFGAGLSFDAALASAKRPAVASLPIYAIEVRLTPEEHRLAAEQLRRSGYAPDPMFSALAYFKLVGQGVDHPRALSSTRSKRERATGSTGSTTNGSGAPARPTSSSRGAGGVAR